MRRTRLALLLTPLLGLALATSSLAAPTKAPQVKDAKGDAVGPRAGTDIVSALFSTTGKGSGKAYVPKQFTVTLTLAGPVETAPGTQYEVEAMTDTCGLVMFTYSPGTPYGNLTGRTGWALWDTCTSSAGDDSSIELIAPTVTGNTIRWEFGMKAIGLKVGTTFKDFKVRVDPSNPALPYPSRGDGLDTGLGLIDSASGTGTWKLS